MADPAEKPAVDAVPGGGQRCRNLVSTCIATHVSLWRTERSAGRLLHGRFARDTITPLIGGRRHGRPGTEYFVVNPIAIF